MTKARSLRSAATLVVLIATIVLATRFASSKIGGIANDGLFRCKTLLSSGSDDEVLFLLFWSFLIPVGVRLARIDEPISVWERLAFLVPALFSILGVATLSECASWLATARTTGDLSLIGMFVLIPIGFLFYVVPDQN